MRKDFLEKLKTDKKTQMAVITSAVGAVLVIAAAITIPVAMHNRVKVEADTESVAITAEAESTEPETEVTSEITTEPTTAETTAQAANNNASAGKNTSANTNKGGGSNKSGGSDSSAQKPNGGSSSDEQAKQETPVATPQKENYDWSQAEVDALIAEAYAYGRTLGLEPATNLTPSNSSWNQPIRTWYGKQETINGVKSEIRHLKQLAEREGITLTGPCYQIYAERYYEAAADGYCWQFYVMR